MEQTHTVEWTDGLKVVRITEVGKQIVLEITWRGKARQFCIGPRSLYVSGKKVSS